MGDDHMIFTDGVLIKAMDRGYFLTVDEIIHRAEPGVLEVMTFAEMVKVIKQLDALAGAGCVEKSTILKEGDNVPSMAYRRGLGEFSFISSLMKGVSANAEIQEQAQEGEQKAEKEENVDG